METIRDYQSKQLNGFQVFISNSRYINTPLEFDSYHAAHFLVVVGANRINYLGAEVKYQERFSINNLNGVWDKNFLKNPQRINAINSFNSNNYSALKSRHRGVLYNDYIDKIIKGKIDFENESYTIKETNEFWFPNIL